MKEINDYSKIFENIVQKTSEYLINNNIKAQILGISGGIDSTVCAAICHEVSKRTNIPLIGRNLPTINNKDSETVTANIVGKAFCDNYDVVGIQSPYQDLLEHIKIQDPEVYEKQTKISNGNIQARLRMMYLYNLASIYNGIVIDTDNLTENNLGYFTIHGDIGDFNPIGGLWKTEVFKLAEWISRTYWRENIEWLQEENFNKNDPRNNKGNQAIAIAKSLALKPTAGLGITNNDLEEIGAESYEQIDYILQEILAWKWLCKERCDLFESILETRNAFLEEQQILNIPINVIIAVTNKHFRSEFKRNKLPIKINREEII